jgi:DNA polymerase III epsilon subunit family exonuclease
MDNHGQLGLFVKEAPEPSPVMKNCSVSSKMSLEISFKKNPARQDLSRAVDGFAKEITKLSGEIKYVSSDHNELPWFEQSFVALDVETTGLDAASCRVIELAIVPFNMSHSVAGFSQLFSIGESLPHEITQITGITEDMLKGKPSFHEKAPEILDQLKNVSFVLAYNAKFDRPFLESELARAHLALPELPWVDPYIFVCELDRFKKGKKLSDSARRWGVNLENAHRAHDDARAAGDLMLKMSDKIDAKTLPELIVQQKIWAWQQAQNMAEYKKANAWSTNR